MIRVMIEATRGSHEKMRFDETTLRPLGSFRVLLPYPYPYGFILGTVGPDGEALDCYILTRDSPPAGTILSCDPVGLLHVDEGGEADHKILAVPAGETAALDPVLLEELRAFINGIFAAYPDTKVRIGPLRSRLAALALLAASDRFR